MRIINGIVIRQRDVGDNDKYVDILTAEGVIEVLVKGVRKINSKTGSSSQLFAYSKFCINEKGERNILNSAEPIHIFYDLRNSLKKIALASYFADIIKYCVTDERRSSDVMRLFLNTLYFLEKDLRTYDFLKSLFELRFISEIGMMPDIVACTGCGSFESDKVYFSIKNSNFYCSDCFLYTQNYDIIEGSLSFLRAVRHIVLSDFERLFNFRVSDNVQKKLSYFSERYIIHHLERKFNTLEFYKSIEDME